MGAPGTGKKIGNYRICEQIGGGAMGRVWRGIDEALGRAVAIKMLRTELADRPELIERFRTEARALARLNHPNIASVFALLEEGDELYLVMEYLKGESLHDRLARRGALRFEECFPLFHQALDGIQHAHEGGVVHRDIKASNLMLGQDGQVKWIDFGIARLDDRKGSTRTGGLMGTPEYMAPEQVRGEAGTVRSDVYSLGVLLYKLLTGRSPFSGSAEFDVMRAHVEEPPPRPSALGAPLGEALEAVLLRALEKDPGARFASARAFQEALVGAGAPEQRGAPPRPRSETEVEATLCDPGAPPPEPTRPLELDDDAGIPATVPGLAPSPFSGAVDPEAPTRLDPELRAQHARLVRWILAGILLAGAAVAVNWIHASREAAPPAAPAATRSAAPQAAPRPEGRSGEGGAPHAAPARPGAPEPPEPRHRDPRPAGRGERGAPGGGSGWEIVR